MHEKVITYTDTYLTQIEACLHLNLRWFHFLRALLDT